MAVLNQDKLKKICLEQLTLPSGTSADDIFLQPNRQRGGYDVYIGETKYGHITVEGTCSN